jgi:hypothetical protein
MIYVTDAELARRARVRRLIGIAVAVALLAGFVQLVLVVNHRPPPDMKERFTDVAPFLAFTDAGPEGWVGRLDPTWAGYTDRAVADAACAALLLRLAPTGTQTILLLDAEGLPAHECLLASQQ